MLQCVLKIYCLHVPALTLNGLLTYWADPDRRNGPSCRPELSCVLGSTFCEHAPDNRQGPDSLEAPEPLGPEVNALVTTLLSCALCSNCFWRLGAGLRLSLTSDSSEATASGLPHTSPSS